MSSSYVLLLLRMLLLPLLLMRPPLHSLLLPLSLRPHSLLGLTFLLPLQEDLLLPLSNPIFLLLRDRLHPLPPPMPRLALKLA